jgi:hypothetical protein
VLGLVSLNFGGLLFGIKIPDSIVGFDIGHRVRSGRFAHSRLTDEFTGSTERTFTDKQILDGMAYTPAPTKGKK